jgi:hypothetical protein
MSTSLSKKMARCVAFSVGLVALAAFGCQNTPIDLSQGPARWRMPRPGEPAESFEDSLTGGEVFAMYCNQCHNARALGERPFANYQNVAAHMRVRANFTGEEYAKLMEFLRRWHDVPSPTPPVEPSPKRLIFSQPIAELHDEKPPEAPPGAAAPAGQPGAAAAAGPAPVAGPDPNTPPVELAPMPAPAGGPNIPPPRAAPSPRPGAGG